MALALADFKGRWRSFPFRTKFLIGETREFLMPRDEVSTYIPSYGDAMEGETAPLGLTASNISSRNDREAGMVWLIVRYTRTRNFGE